MTLQVFKNGKLVPHWSTQKESDIEFNKENEENKSVSLYNVQKEAKGLTENAANERNGSNSTI